MKPSLPSQRIFVLGKYSAQAVEYRQAEKRDPQQSYIEKQQGKLGLPEKHTSSIFMPRPPYLKLYP
jgi:hypothetical protein